MEGITFSHLSAKLSNIISDVFFVNVVVLLQHGSQRNSIFCAHQMRHVTQRIAKLLKEFNVTPVPLKTTKHIQPSLDPLHPQHKVVYEKSVRRYYRTHK